jgi:hypothetical protein
VKPSKAQKTQNARKQFTSRRLLYVRNFGRQFLESYLIPIKKLSRAPVETQSVAPDQAFCGLWASLFLAGKATEFDIDLTHRIKFINSRTYLLRTEKVNIWEYGIKTTVAHFYYALQ